MSHRLITTGIAIRHAPRRGVVLIVVIATISISLALFGLWAQNMVRDHRRQAYQQFRLQVARLAEAGLQRAIARRAADPAFEQETWSVPADQLGGNSAASVQLRVVPNNATSAVRFEAIAEYPAGSVRRAQISKQIAIPVPPSENES